MCIKEALLLTLSISAIQNKQIIMLRVNDQRLRSGFNFRLPTVWDAPSSVYEVPMVMSITANACILERLINKSDK